MSEQDSGDVVTSTPVEEQGASAPAGESPPDAAAVGEAAEAVPASEGSDPAEEPEEPEEPEAKEASEGGARRERAGRDRTAQLEREGEVAADFLERLLDIADLDGDIDVDIDGDRASVAIVDSEEGRVPRRLVGPDGRVLEALQELTRMAVQAETGERSRLMLDVADHRAQRRKAVLEVARVAIEACRDTGQPQPLEPMTAFERKVAHDEVLRCGLVSESEGVEPQRHVVVMPA